MVSELMKAYEGIFYSSQEIVKNNQRHLYVNMLTLFTRTSRAVNDSGEHYIKDKYIEFCLKKILPLVFDTDLEIQNSAIQSLEDIMPFYTTSDIYNIADWSYIKCVIIEKYSQQIHEFRQSLNSNWHKIWSIMITILNKEILKGATVINTFLSIVELGFRSNDYNIRAEAFLCWKILIKIFADNNELSSMKRIKLICIPLKSSHCKTLQAARNKLLVWWDFICKLDSNVETTKEFTLEPFLIFVFGEFNKDSTRSSFRMYEELQEMSALCLIMMLGSVPPQLLPTVERYKLTSTNNLLQESTIKHLSKEILHGTIEVIASRKETDSKDNISVILFKYVIKIFSKIAPDDFYQLILQQIQINCFQNHQKMSELLDMLSSETIFPYDIITKEMFFKITKSFEELILDSRCAYRQVELIISSIYNFRKYTKIGIDWAFLRSVFLKPRNINENRDVIYSIIFVIWTEIAQTVCVSALEITSDWYNFIAELFVWPYKIFDNLNISNLGVVENLKTIQLNFFQYLKNSFPHNHKIVYIISSELTQILNKIENPEFSDLLCEYIKNVYIPFGDDCKPIGTMNLLTCILNQHIKDSILKSTEIFLCSLTEKESLHVFDDIKHLILKIKDAEKENNISKKSYAEFKIRIQQHFKNFNNKNNIKQLKNILQPEDNFVVIPSVWTLNPEKLTERQKEKLNEKRTDIPALYNDISQSEDASIKAWMPKNNVLTNEKKYDNDITLSSLSIHDIHACSTNNAVYINQPGDKISKRENKKNTVHDNYTDSGSTENPLCEHANERCFTTNVQSNLSSPERNKSLQQNVGNASPKSKSKLSVNRMGRGAQFINMIRNKKSAALFLNSNEKVTKQDVNKLEVVPSSTNIDNNTAITSSPSSILKRKVDAIDDHINTNCVKRKRVSFHDPPVSATKEYSITDLNQVNESFGTRNPEPTTQFSSKYTLKRTTRNCCLETEKLVPNDPSIGKQKCNGDVFYLKFDDEEAVLNHIFNRYKFPDLLDWYVSSQKIQTKVLSNAFKQVAEKSEPFRFDILETMSENYPVEFLDHALRENLSSKVCEKLNPNLLIDYIFNIATKCELVRESLLLKFGSLDLSSDLINHIEYLIKNNTMTTEEILKCIRILTNKNL